MISQANHLVSLQGGEKYQQAFYVFEELAQAPATSSVRTLVAQAVAELHLGRTEEAQAALEQALKKEPGYAEAIANLLVLNVIVGKSPKELTRYATQSLLKFVWFWYLTMIIAPWQRPTPSTRSSRIWPRRASCSTRLRPSTRPRWLRRGIFMIIDD